VILINIQFRRIVNPLISFHFHIICGIEKSIRNYANFEIYSSLLSFPQKLYQQI